MVRRSKLRSSHMIGMEMDQQSWAHPPPRPGVLFGSITNSPRPRNSSGAFFYGMTHFNDVQNHHPAPNIDLGVASSPNHFTPYMSPSDSTVFPAAVDHGSHDQFPSSSNHGMVVVSTNGYGGSTHFMEGSGRSFKIKNEEGIPWNLHTSSFESRGNEIPPISEASSHRSVRNRSGATGVVHTPNHTIQGNYPGPSFQTAGSLWLDPLFSSNGGDGSTLAWNQTPALIYVHGSNANGGYIEPGNMASSGTTTNFIHVPPTRQVQHSLPHVLPPMQGHRGHNISVHSQVSGSSRRLSTNSGSHTSLNPFQDGMEMGRRYVGPVPRTGIMIHRPQQRGVMLGVTPRHHNLPLLRIMPEVAILDISSYYEVGNSTDQHRDMRLDIDHMSYEELLALGERIGNVGSGILEETIMGHLKSRTYISSPTSTNLEEASDVDQEHDFCVICQIDYKNQEKIGTLDCGHEYHLDCIKKWLLVKNACPICKSSALTTETKDF